MRAYLLPRKTLNFVPSKFKKEFPEILQGEEGTAPNFQPIIEANNMVIYTYVTIFLDFVYRSKCLQVRQVSNFTL